MEQINPKYEIFWIQHLQNVCVGRGVSMYIFFKIKLEQFKTELRTIVNLFRIHCTGAFNSDQIYALKN